jgi:hypothetical protein
MLAAAIGAGEQRIFAVQRDRSDAALHHVGIDLDAAVIKEAAKPVRLKRMWVQNSAYLRKGRALRFSTVRRSFSNKVMTDGGGGLLAAAGLENRPGGGFEEAACRSPFRNINGSESQILAL